VSTVPPSSSSLQSTSTRPDPNALDGCVPQCRTGLTTPGSLPKGVYTTKFFFGGRMQVTVSGGWSSGEDSTGEFNIGPDARPADDVFFWEDIYPVKDGQRIATVPQTAKGLLDWFLSTPRLAVSNVTTGSIGALPATVFDVHVPDSAANEDPGCPAPACVLPLGFPQWDDTWGITATQVQRFYLSDVTYSGRHHLFVAVIYPDQGSDMDAFAPIAETLLATVHVPATPA
jgi:hypothetical protein